MKLFIIKKQFKIKLKERRKKREERRGNLIRKNKTNDKDQLHTCILFGVLGELYKKRDQITAE